MKRTEDKIRRAFENATPNVLGTVLSQSCEEKGTVILMTEKKKNRFKFKEFAATAAAVVLLFGVGYFAAGMIGSQGQFSQGQNNDTKPQIISKETAEQIAFVDYFDYTLSSPEQQPTATTVLKEENDSIYYSVEFFYLDKIHTYSIDAYTGEIKDTDTRPFIGNTISWKDARDVALKHAGVKLENLTEMDIELEDQSFEISFEAQGPFIEYKYSIDIFSGNINRHSLEPLDKSDRPEMAISSAVLRYAAVDIVLEHAGIFRDDLIELDTEFEDGRYKIDFKTESGAFYYLIDALNLQILSPVSTIPTPNDGKITADAAIDLAVAHFGLNRSNVMFESCELDNDKSFPHYDVSFYCGGYEYECEVGINNREIRDAEKEPVEYGNASGSAQLNEMISQKKALELAIEHFKLERDKITSKECEIDDDDGKHLHYDVSFSYNGYEYDCEVDVYEGTIRNAEKERDD